LATSTSSASNLRLESGVVEWNFAEPTESNISYLSGLEVPHLSIQIEVFWVVTPCSLVDKYRFFVVAFRLHLQVINLKATWRRNQGDP
jgi:hypothetical protein